MSNQTSNQINIPQAREVMDKFKMQAAQEVGVNLQNGYNGHLTSREAGSVQPYGHPIRTARFEKADRVPVGHIQAA